MSEIVNLTASLGGRSDIFSMSRISGGTLSTDEDYSSTVEIGSSNASESDRRFERQSSKSGTGGNQAQSTTLIP